MPACVTVQHYLIETSWIKGCRVCWIMTRIARTRGKLNVIKLNVEMLKLKKEVTILIDCCINHCDGVKCKFKKAQFPLNLIDYALTRENVSAACVRPPKYFWMSHPICSLSPRHKWALHPLVRWLIWAPLFPSSPLCPAFTLDTELHQTFTEPSHTRKQMHKNTHTHICTALSEDQWGRQMYYAQY